MFSFILAIVWLVIATIELIGGKKDSIPFWSFTILFNIWLAAFVVQEGGF